MSCSFARTVRSSRPLRLLCIAAAGLVQAAQAERFTLTTNLLAPKPISPRLYGNFLELGYGLQVEPMMAQMFFNRSFEPFTPYKPISIEWFDLWHDPRDPAKGYKTDWTGEDWYHTGYEHNPWFAAPGSGGRLPIDEQATFIITHSPLVNVVLRTEPGGSGHGRQCLRIINHEPGRHAGLAQEGKFLRRGQTYHFRGKLRAVGKPVRAEMRLYPTGQWDRPLAVIPLKEVGRDWTEVTGTFKNRSFSGWATFALWLPPETAVLADDFSLLPARHYHGWRTDILQPLRRIQPAIRKPQPSHFWGGQWYNDVGVAELALLARAVGAELMYCVNVHHPLKADFEWYFGEDSVPPGRHGYDFRKFQDVKEGALQAAGLVAYCNLPAGAHPLATLRAQHGFRQPFGIRFWELDNEVHRWFEPEEYARAAVEYARAMKSVDPSIRIGLVTYGERLKADGTPRVTYHERVPALLEIAGPHVDFLADRGPSAEDYLQRMLGWIHDYNRRHGTSIVYCETEKLFYEQFPDVENRVQPTGGYSKSFLFSKWFYALKVLMDYLAYQRAGGDIDFVIFNNLANTHSQCVLETPKEGVFLTAAGLAMNRLARSPAAWPLAFEGYRAAFDDNFQVSAAWSRDRRRLVLYVLNRTAQPREAAFDFSALGRRFNRVETATLRADDPFAMNTLANPQAIQTERQPKRKLPAPHELRIQARPWSFTEAIVE